MSVVIRRATVDDAPALCELWAEAGLDAVSERVEDELASVLARDPELVLVATGSTGLVGSVFGTFDGRRGWVNRLATRADHRGQGVARRLMAQLEEALVGMGCRKINLLVEPSNAGVVPFYAGLGYDTDELIFMEKHLQV